MELQGICHKMHAGLKDASVTDQQTTKANVEYKFVLDRSEIDLPFNLGQELEIEWTGNIYCTSCGAKHQSLIRKATALNALKRKRNVTFAL